MRKIGHLEEGASDIYTSFHPHELDRTCSHVDGSKVDDYLRDGTDRESDGLTAEARDFEEGQRYLPCHYFEYVGVLSSGTYVNRS